MFPRDRIPPLPFHPNPRFATFPQTLASTGHRSPTGLEEAGVQGVRRQAPCTRVAMSFVLNDEDSQ